MALYARGAIDADRIVIDVREHVAVVENSATNDAHVLALYASGVTSSSLDSYNNFITFFSRNAGNSGDEAVGAIEGTGGGVTLDTTAADFAEWLPRLVREGTIQPGDIVGIRGGRISKDLTGAEHLHVVSTSPAVAGGAPAGDKQDYERVAFLGQVPTRVTGPVAAGDYILPSGNDDGVGRAVPAAALGATEVARVIGRAWESSDEPGVKRVNVAVGVETSAAARALENQAERIAALERELADKSGALERLAARFEQMDRRMASLATARQIAAADGRPHH